MDNAYNICCSSFISNVMFCHVIFCHVTRLALLCVPDCYASVMQILIKWRRPLRLPLTLLQHMSRGHEGPNRQRYNLTISTLHKIILFCKVGLYLFKNINLSNVYMWCNAIFHVKRKYQFTARNIHGQRRCLSIIEHQWLLNAVLVMHGATPNFQQSSCKTVRWEEYNE